VQEGAEGLHRKHQHPLSETTELQVKTTPLKGMVFSFTSRHSVRKARRQGMLKHQRVPAESFVKEAVDLPFSDLHLPDYQAKYISPPTSPTLLLFADSNVQFKYNRLKPTASGQMARFDA
jgi:hypothetical protein